MSPPLDRIAIFPFPILTSGADPGSPVRRRPRTFAPSKEDVLQNLQYFFGAPVAPEKLKDYSEHHAMTYHFPDACALYRIELRPAHDASRLLLTPLPFRFQTPARTPRSGIPSTT